MPFSVYKLCTNFARDIERELKETVSAGGASHGVKWENKTQWQWLEGCNSGEWFVFNSNSAPGLGYLLPHIIQAVAFFPGRSKEDFS